MATNSNSLELTLDGFAGVIRGRLWELLHRQPLVGEQLQAPRPSERVGDNGLHPPPFAARSRSASSTSTIGTCPAGVFPQPDDVEVRHVADLHGDDRGRIARVGAVEPEHHLGVVGDRPGLGAGEPGLPRQPRIRVLGPLAEPVAAEIRLPGGSHRRPQRIHVQEVTERRVRLGPGVLVVHLAALRRGVLHVTRTTRRRRGGRARRDPT